MALVFEVDEKGVPRPTIRCDGCGGIIKDHANGVAVFDPKTTKPGQILEPIFRCRGCEEEEKKTNPNHPSMPIDHFMLYLLNNIQLTPNAIEDAGRRLTGL